MLHVILTIIQLIFKLVFLPVRLALHILAFVLKTLLAVGTIATSILSTIFLGGAVLLLILGQPSYVIWGTLISGLVFAAFPYVGAYVVAIPLLVAEFLKQITSAHPFEDDPFEGGSYYEA